MADFMEKRDFYAMSAILKRLESVESAIKILSSTPTIASTSLHNPEGFNHNSNPGNRKITPENIRIRKFVKLACLWIAEVIHVLVRCAQLKELLMLPKVCVKTQEPQLITEHNNVSRTSLRRILHKDLGLFTYKLHLTQEVKENDHPLRYRFSCRLCVTAYRVCPESNVSEFFFLRLYAPARALRAGIVVGGSGNKIEQTGSPTSVVRKTPIYHSHLGIIIFVSSDGQIESFVEAMPSKTKSSFEKFFYTGLRITVILPVCGVCHYFSIKVHVGTRKLYFSRSDDAASVLALHSVREAPRLSLRRRAIETETSKSYLPRIFKQNRILPFKPKFRHTLEEGDEAKRLDFCLEMGNRVLNDVGFHKRILFSDESSFSTNGVVSSQHCRYWSETNPHFTISCRRQYFIKVNVWCAVSYTNCIIGPYFFQRKFKS
ncbi:hypothetical protein NQ318_013779 [Aromia moschata]|uniref:Uncharacterized protein n=1 Tax=Aromia moschata TaxID=1265417 RepID=A0AAV8Z9B3_9CUCU|nr:hypothetical protein NQ318_013779 [Aromia moschata]